MAISLIQQSSQSAAAAINPVVIALIGVIAGATVTGAVNFFLQRAADNRRFAHEAYMQNRRWEHEDNQKQREARARVYSELWGVVKTVELFPKSAVSDDWNFEWSRTVVELQMYGTPSTIDAARELYEIVQRMVQSEPSDEKGKVELRTELTKREEKFRQAVKADLGLDLEPNRSPIN